MTEYKRWLGQVDAWRQSNFTDERIAILSKVTLADVKDIPLSFKAKVSRITSLADLLAFEVKQKNPNETEAAAIEWRKKQLRAGK